MIIPTEDACIQALNNIADLRRHGHHSSVVCTTYRVLETLSFEDANVRRSYITMLAGIT